MKKILFSIFTLLFVGLGFCSAVPNFTNTYLSFPNTSDAYLTSGSVSQVPISAFNNSTNGYFLISTAYSSGDYSVNTDVMICASFIFSSLTANSSLNSYITQFNSNLYWNISDSYGDFYRVSSTPCMFFKKGSIPAIGMTGSRSYSYLQNSYVGYKFFSLSDMEFNYNISPTYSSLECQTEYNLIPVDDVNSNYCEVNNLCPALTGGAGTGVSWSALYINNIQYLGGPNIYVNIDEGLQWLYDNSDSNSFVIDVEGYNYDMEYLDDITTIQEFTPSSDDFSKLFTLFGPFSGLLVGLLFVILVFYFIKKLF